MSYSSEKLQLIWEKGVPIPKCHTDMWRKDEFGSCMKRDKYGNRESVYGWEVDHIKSVKDGGSDDLSNLQPLQWKNNAFKEGWDSV
ncbi:MAG: HNH endonuclease signature motif containing protein [Gammaproteobacteria bacterium]|nr:HNH endonuclease signature motif containing protein [Gammaproteobacteria bacterium]